MTTRRGAAGAGRRLSRVVRARRLGGSPRWSPGSARPDSTPGSRRGDGLSADVRGRGGTARRVRSGAELADAARLGIRFVIPGDAGVAGSARGPRRRRAAQRPGRGPDRAVGRGPGPAGRARRVGGGGRLPVCHDVRRPAGRRTSAGLWPRPAGPSSPVRRSGSTAPPTEARSPVGGPTVAVLACGVDRAYPTAHAPLLDHLAAVGAVVSEAPLGCAPQRIRFLARNRLIAALTGGTVVVEAAVRSGALNTANWANRLQPAGDGGAGPGHQRSFGRGAPAHPHRQRPSW